MGSSPNIRWSPIATLSFPSSGILQNIVIIHRNGQWHGDGTGGKMHSFAFSDFQIYIYT